MHDVISSSVVTLFEFCIKLICLVCGFVDHLCSEICADVFDTTCIQLKQETQFKIVMQREAPLENKYKTI
jgi:hypothetical protein